MLKHTYAEVLETYSQDDVTMREACYMRALQRLANVYQMRGVFP